MFRVIEVLAFTLLIIFKLVAATAVDNCTLGTGAFPQEVILSNCLKSPCTFYINDNSNVVIKFRSPRYLENFAPRVTAVAMGLNVPYPLGQNDGCVGVTNTPCPLAENEYIEYSYSMFILPIFPKISFTMEFSLVDKDRAEEQFLCFRADMNLEDLPSN